jgi:uncharacterized protein
MMLNSLECRKVDGKGWGIFTTEPIRKGTIVELSPVVMMPIEEMEHLNKTKLHNYIFDWEDGQCCMALGNVSLYNHACPSNCEYFQDSEDHTIFIKTVRNIKADEELTINYNGDYDNDKEVWFDVL